MKRIELLVSVGRGAKLSLAALLVAGAMAAAVPDRAEATPVHSVCYPGDEVGYYEWYDDGQGNFTDSIGINDCALEGLGAGLIDRERVIAHEMGHANGLPHSSDPSDVMYHDIEMWGI